MWNVELIDGIYWKCMRRITVAGKELRKYMIHNDAENWRFGLELSNESK